MQHSTINVGCFFNDFPSHSFFSPAYFIVRTVYVIYTTYKLCIDWLFVIGRLYVVNFGVNQSYMCIFFLKVLFVWERE